MVVIRLIGDEWKFSEKIAIAIPPAKTFLMCATTLRDKLQIPSWNGCALYYTEGKPPNYCRATVPVPMGSTPGKEGLKDGALLYVKVNCDATRQEKDRNFHEALVAWRKSNNIAGILSDGSDVFEFLDEYSSRLQPSLARDITEHEAEIRDKIEGEEARSYFVLTFEYRELQQLKDEEASARDEVVTSWKNATAVLYRDYIATPLFRWRVAQLCEVEERGRNRVIAEKTACDDALQAEAAKLRSKRAAAAAQQSGPKAGSLPGNGSNIGLPPVDSDTLQRLLMHAASGSGPDTGSTEWKREIAEIRNLMQGLMASQTRSSEQLAEAYDRISTTLEARYLQHMESVLHNVSTMASRDVTVPIQREEEMLLREKQRLLRELLADETRHLEDARFAQKQQDNDVTLHLVAAAAESQSDIARLVDANLQIQHATEAALDAATQENFRLLRQVALQDELLQAQERELEALNAEVAQYEERVSTGLMLECTVEVNGRKWRHASQEFSHTHGLHPELHALCVRVVQAYVRFPSHVYEAVLGYPLGATVRVPDPLSPVERLDHDDRLVRHSAEAATFVDNLVETVAASCFSSPAATVDELCFRFRIPCHPLRRKFLRVLDDHRPHLACGVDLLLDVFNGREAELMVQLLGANRGEFFECRDPDTGATYFYHPSTDVTQWERPHVG